MTQNLQREINFLLSWARNVPNIAFDIMKTCYFVILALLFIGCAETEVPPPEPVAAEPTPEATSLFGEPLHRATFSPERQATLEGNLAEAQVNYEANPGSVDNIIWLGRRQAYLWGYNEAIDTFSKGIAQHPDEPRLYRHRGHRYITVRDFDNAIADLERAAALIEGTEDEVEPDGAPNAAGIPTSTLHTNIWYHLGLAYYLQGRFDEALKAYRHCLAASKNNDMQVATLDWLYMTLRRLGQEEEAQAAIAEVHADMELLENYAYHRRLLMYKGEMSPDSLLQVDNEEDAALTLATQGYGVGNWHQVNGDTEKAKEIFQQVLGGTYWAAFGYLAAEADLKRMEEE